MTVPSSSRFPGWSSNAIPPTPAKPAQASRYTVGTAITNTLKDGLTRDALLLFMSDHLELKWSREAPLDDQDSKRDIITAYIHSLPLPALVNIARRITDSDVPEHHLTPLTPLIHAYDTNISGVPGQVKNLIFAAHGPKPEIVLHDAINNDITITKNEQYCLVYDQPIPTHGLHYSDLITWWRTHNTIPDTTDDYTIARQLHTRLEASLAGNPVELALFRAYATRYQTTFNTPALIPQVYLHYDPTTARQHHRNNTTSALARQRMDFLILPDGRRRIVLEVDGKQHYADGNTASPTRYAAMVAEDRRLRLAGYEVYRFGGHELDPTNPHTTTMLTTFFNDLLPTPSATS